MSALPAEYYARCTETECSWEVTTTELRGNGDPAIYRDRLAQQHRTYYGHEVTTQDYT